MQEGPRFLPSLGDKALWMRAQPICRNGRRRMGKGRGGRRITVGQSWVLPLNGPPYKVQVTLTFQMGDEGLCPRSPHSCVRASGMPSLRESSSVCCCRRLEPPSRSGSEVLCWTCASLATWLQSPIQLSTAMSCALHALSLRRSSAALPTRLGDEAQQGLTSGRQQAQLFWQKSLHSGGWERTCTSPKHLPSPTPLGPVLTCIS